MRFSARLALAWLSLLFVSAASAGIQEWTSLGLSGESICSLAVDPYDATILYAGTCSDGIFKSTDSGASWSSANAGLQCLSVNSLLTGPPSALFAEIDSASYEQFCSGLFKSTDGGGQWAPTGPPYDHMIGSLIRDPRSPLVLHTIAAHCVIFHGCTYSAIKSVDGGNTWLASLNSPFRPSDLLINPLNSQWLYLAVDIVYLSTDGGVSWVGLPSAAFQGTSPAFLAMDPFHPSSLFSAIPSGGLLQSTDGGGRWSSAGFQDPTLRGMVFDPFMENSAYLWDDSGLWASTDGGQNWAALSQGLNGAAVTTLAFKPAERKILAGTAGNGILEYQFAVASQCLPNSTTLCLDGGRFQVQAQWTDFNGNSGVASVVPGATSNDSGVMWFFSPDNWELLIKVLDGCAVNGHYWVLGAAATNVAYTIQVTDTQTGEVKTYSNPLGTVSSAITDTAAFGSCP